MPHCPVSSGSTTNTSIDKNSVNSNSTIKNSNRYSGLSNNSTTYNSPTELLLSCSPEKTMAQNDNMKMEKRNSVGDAYLPIDITSKGNIEEDMTDATSMSENFESFEASNNGENADITNEFAGDPSTVTQEILPAVVKSENILPTTPENYLEKINDHSKPTGKVKNKISPMNLKGKNENSDPDLGIDIKAVSAIEKLEKDLNTLKAQIDSIKQELETERRSNKELKNEIAHKDNKLRNKEERFEKLNSTLEKQRAEFSQVRKHINELKDTVTQGYTLLRNEMVTIKSQLIDHSNKTCDALEQQCQKRLWAKKSFNSTLNKAITTINARISDLTKKEEKKIEVLTNNLREKEIELSHVNFVVSNLRLFDINLGGTIYSVKEELSESINEEDKKLLFQKCFQTMNPNIVGFRTVNDSVLVNDIKKALSNIKTNFDIDFVKNLQKMISESNSNKDKGWLELQDRIENLQESKGVQSYTISSLENQNNHLKLQLQQLEEENNSIKAEMNSQYDVINQTNKQIQSLIGDEHMKITFEQILLNNKGITKETFDQLEVDQIDELTIVELQNVIKNLIIFLNIPFSKMTQKIPLIGIYLMYERNIYAHFANRLYYQIHGIQITLADFNREAYSQYTVNKTLDNIKHPLEACLDNLCARIITKL
ncbi:hypothetical protein C6P45_000578 [Maudiozyma exigua]|uniref:Uncharacterized protein n=1 Tax=Maudiozyma exigua TaxID=34358 RepID=A0A9P6WDL8_MAUEX|nr:hypothetical protein C6P45_000578 [Kazachstania exigua]